MAFGGVPGTEEEDPRAALVAPHGARDDLVAFHVLTAAERLERHPVAGCFAAGVVTLNLVSFLIVLLGPPITARVGERQP